jgi:hypothetical protein
VTLLALTACAQKQGIPLNAAPPASPVSATNRVIFTYYFYWYDAQTGGHLNPQVLRYRFPPTPPPSWRSLNWQEKQLGDMAAAGIDCALAVYWGHDRPQDDWSYKGLDIMAQAYHALVARGQPAAKIGMFLDTTIDDNRDLTTDSGKEWFYSNFKDFFTRIPKDEWQLVDGRPVVWLFTSNFTHAFNQSTFDYVYSQFESDFGVRPYIVREVSWDYPISNWQGDQATRDFQKPIQTDNNYLWAAAVHGYVDRGGVAAVGPGYDDHGLPGRGRGTITDRQNGNFYKAAWRAALRSGKNLVAIETWSEMHEGSNICETVEFGRQYIDITRQYADLFHIVTA